MLPRPEVVAEIANFIPVQLHTDGLDAKSKYNNQLQQRKFGTVAIPLYAVVSPDEKELGRLEGLHRDPQVFISFLQKSGERSALKR